MHNQTSRYWAKEVWQFPRIHNWDFGFGLTVEDATKASTIVPYAWQDNAIVDYETIKTNPENADFAVVGYPNVCKGSVIGNIFVDWTAQIFPTDTEIQMLKFNTLDIHTSMLNRLDAFDEKTGNDIETIIELTHETTDQQTYPVYNTVKLFEGMGARDVDFTQNVGLTTDGQLEGVAFDKEMYFDALHYYTNKEMLRKVTGNMLTYTVTDPLVNAKHAIAHQTMHHSHPICKMANPYMFCGQLFHLPQAGGMDQYHIASQTTAIEHLSIRGRVRFNEFNNQFNFARS